MELDDALSNRKPYLDTVRALHQTVVALRAALEQSKSEILELKAKTFPINSVQDALRTLSIENHVLRTKLLESSHNIETEESVAPQVTQSGKEIVKKEALVVDIANKTNNDNCCIDDFCTSKKLGSPKISHLEEKPKKQVTIISPEHTDKTFEREFESKIIIKTETFSPKKISRSFESLTVLKSPKFNSRQLTFSKTLSFSNISSTVSGEFSFSLDELSAMSGNTEEIRENPDESSEERLQSPQNDLDQDQEVDDIELIFTTDDTKESDFKEQLVSIDAGESTTEALNLLQCPVSDFEISDRELDDDVFNDNNENENQENINFQSCEFKRENSQLYNSKSDNSINHEEKSFKSYYSYQDSSFENKSLEKDESFDRFEERIRIVETDISKCGIHDVEYIGSRRNTCPNPIQYRPLIHREAMSRGFGGRKSRPILAHSNAVRKESGAQTDISALPGSSWRSESSLANKTRMGENFTTLPSKYPHPGSRLRLSEKTVEARRVLLSDIGFTSMVPELSRSADHLCPAELKPPPVTTYGQFLRTTDLYSPGYASHKFSWTATTASPSETSQTHSRYSSIYPLSSPPAPSRRCSAPVSPSRRPVLKTTPSKVRFANGSLPELRGDWSIDSGDSTDSLVEEAENYLRRSIDCLLSGRDVVTFSEVKKTVPRRASAPEPTRDNIPPQGWLPFLPRLPRDLKLDHWVKVITPEGRVRGGRVRYIGPVVSQTDQFVGVQLSNPEGYCDGTFGNRRYFQCEPYHGIFVPFKKVIMGWKP